MSVPQYKKPPRGMTTVWQVAETYRGREHELRGRGATLIERTGEHAYDVRIRLFQVEDDWRIELTFWGINENGEVRKDSDGFDVWGMRTYYDHDSDMNSHAIAFYDVDRTAAVAPTTRETT